MTIPPNHDTALGRKQLRSRVRTTITPIVTSVFLAIIFVIVLNLFQNSATISLSSEGLWIFLVLLVSYLIFSGRLSEFGGAGFVLRLRQVSQSNLAVEKVSTLQVRDLVSTPEIVPKGSWEYLKQNLAPRLFYGKITTLSIKQGDTVNRYILSDYLSYLTTSPHFRDVIFVDENGHFKGWIDPQVMVELLNLYENATPLIDAINEGRLSDIPGVSTLSVFENTTNRDTLRTMLREKVNRLSVVDQQGRFIGSVERDAIVDAPIIKAMTETT